MCASKITKTNEINKPLAERDEVRLVGMLMDLRLSARIILAGAHNLRSTKNQDARAIMLGQTKDLVENARALRNALKQLGVRDLGPELVFDEEGLTLSSID